MKPLIVFLMAVSIMMACEQNVSQEAASTNTQSLNKKIPSLDLNSFESMAAQYVNQEVRITGLVDHVCIHSGKKLRLVADGAPSLHVASETRFDDALVGTQIALTGIVKETRIDESYCLQMEESSMEEHKEGHLKDDQLANRTQQIKAYREAMKEANVDYLAFYSLEFVSMIED
jgi:hypothetical protein